MQMNIVDLLSILIWLILNEPSQFITLNEEQNIVVSRHVEHLIKKIKTPYTLIKIEISHKQATSYSSV